MTLKSTKATPSRLLEIALDFFGIVAYLFRKADKKVTDVLSHVQTTSGAHICASIAEYCCNVVSSPVPGLNFLSSDRLLTEEFNVSAQDL